MFFVLNSQNSDGVVILDYYHIKIFCKLKSFNLCYMLSQ